MQLNDLLLGSQTPTLLFEPAGATDYSLGDLAVGWAEAVGYELYPWQQFCVRKILARRDDGLWAARDVVLEVTRQQGKNVVLEVVELFLVFAVGVRLLVHSAHRADTSAEHFLRLRDAIKSSEDLYGQMPTHRQNDGFTTANGKESIETNHEPPRRILFKARQSNAGRGPSPQVIVIDEAFDCPPSAIGSLAPSLTAQRNPLILFASSAPKASSLLLHDLHTRAVEADPNDRLLYIGWRSEPGVDPESDEAIARVSPSLGLGRVSIESIKANKKLLRRFPGEYEREHLGVAEAPVDADESPIPPEVWEACARESSIVSHHQFALAVSPDRRWASVGVAGRNADGKLHVEWVEHRGNKKAADADEAFRHNGRWITDVLVKAQRPVRIHKNGPEGALIAPLVEAGVEVIEVPTAEVAHATGLFLDLANEREIVHINQPSLNKAVAGATLRVTTQGASIWDQRGSVEITPLMAVTVAAGGVPGMGPGEWFVY